MNMYPMLLSGPWQLVSQLTNQVSKRIKCGEKGLNILLRYR